MLLFSHYHDEKRCVLSFVILHVCLCTHIFAVTFGLIKSQVFFWSTVYTATMSVAPAALCYMTGAAATKQRPFSTPDNCR